MPDDLICEECHAPIHDLDWGTDGHPVCFDCYWELVTEDTAFEPDIELEVERRR